MNDDVKAAFQAMSDEVRPIALRLRSLILQVAAETPQAGKIEECLRWGQPSYLTSDTKSGSTLRIAPAKGGGCGIYAHCQTNIISTYAASFPGLDRIDGNRGVIFEDIQQINADRLGLLIFHALTYHRSQPL